MLVSGVEWSDLIIHIYFFSFLDSFSVQIITRYWVQFPVLYTSSLLVICFIYVLVCIFRSKTPNLSLSPFLFGNYVCFPCLWVYFCSANQFVCIIFYFLNYLHVCLATLSGFSSVQSLSHVQLFATPWIAAHQASLSITSSQSSTNSCPPSRWCHPTISSSVVPFSSCSQSLPASESFKMSQLFTWGGQSTGVSALALFLPKNTQDWSPLEWTGWISLQTKGLSRVFSNTTV